MNTNTIPTTNIAPICEDGMPRLLAEHEISDCLSEPHLCSFQTDYAEPEVGIMMTITYCETHGWDSTMGPVA